MTVNLNKKSLELQNKAQRILAYFLCRLYPAAHELNPDTGRLFKRRNLALKTFALIQHDRVIDERFTYVESHEHNVVRLQFVSFE